MPMGRRDRERQQELFVTPDQLPTSAGHPFYRKLNALLAEAGFDEFVEAACRRFYDAGGKGRPSVPPGVYFRMLLVGYFEGIDSQRGIDWRCADSLALREFLGVPLTEATPDHSTLTRTRDRLDQEAHDKAFEFVLRLAADKGLLDPKAVGVDGTTLEANAAMRGIVRRDTGEGYKEYLRRLAAAEGIAEPTDEELRRFDRKRKGKRCSNAEWESPTDPEAEIARMKDKRTHLAYKAEHVVDLASEFVLAAEIHPATAGDAATLVDSVLAAQGHLDAAATLTPEPRTEKQVEAATGAGPRIAEAAADKGYHKAGTLDLAEDLGIRTYVPERKRPAKGGGKAKGNGKGKKGKRRAGGGREPRAVRNNRRRMAREKGKRLGRRRSETVERSFAHVCETGGARRTWLRGKAKIRKRYLIVAAARNLGLLMLKLFGIGKPRGLQGAGRAAARAAIGWRRLLAALGTHVARWRAAVVAWRWIVRARLAPVGSPA